MRRCVFWSAHTSCLFVYCHICVCVSTIGLGLVCDLHLCGHHLMKKNRVNSTLLLPFILEANIINFYADISDNLVAAKWVKSTVTRYPDLFLPTTIDKLLPLPF